MPWQFPLSCLCGTHCTAVRNQGRWGAQILVDLVKLTVGQDLPILEVAPRFELTDPAVEYRGRGHYEEATPTAGLGRQQSQISSG